MAIKAADVKELRERTGAGMMECKKALVEAEGDMDAAIEVLRVSGLAKADKKADRVAAEGVITMSGDAQRVAVVEINCETDFVGKDENFIEFANNVATVAHRVQPADVKELMDTEDGGKTLEQHRQELVAKVGENVQVRRFNVLATDGALGSYAHGTRIGAVVEIEGGSEELARDLAMHVAAIKPQFVDQSEVPAEVIEKEKAVLVDQAKDSGKPENIIEKMVEGRLRKFLAEITLVGQPFVKDPDMTVEKLLAKEGAKLKRFVRMEVGEGIEKKQENFAEEVMAQVNG